MEILAKGFPYIRCISMNKASVIVMFLSVLFCGSAHAEAIKNSEFLKLSEGQQHWWYNGAYTALGHIVSMKNDAKKTQCVWDWYFKNPSDREKQLVKSFELYPDHAPTSIVISLLRRDCGVFNQK
jgi:hypothetical protein